MITLDVVKQYKSKFKDIDETKLQNLIELKKIDIVQLKYDGWWVLCVWHGKQLRLYSATARELATFDVGVSIDIPEYFVGEYIYGTNWALNTNLPHKLYLHDVKVTVIGETNYVNYAARLEYTAKRVSMWCNPCIGIVQSWSVSRYKELWDHFVVDKGYEGLVFKSSSAGSFKDVEREPLFRMKKAVEMDYVCVRVNEGRGRLEGTMGSLDAGLIVNGKFIDVCSVGGGFTDSQRNEIWANATKCIGKVFTATGKQLFSSGALRHPTFDRWRPDKQANDCVFNTDEE